MNRSRAKRQLIFVTAAAVLLAGAAFAANPAFAHAGGGGHKGGGQTGGGTASITLEQTDPHLGDLVTFTTIGGSQIEIACYQGISNMVYLAIQPVGTAFRLGGTNSQWLTVGGSAICYAYLGDGRSWITSTIFSAGGAR